MVFSVQQGEHGPLVVYKLKVPGAAQTAVPAAATPPRATVTLDRLVTLTPEAAPLPQTSPAAIPPATLKSPRLSPLEPTILGTVVMPAPRRTTPRGTAVPAAPPRNTAVPAATLPAHLQPEPIQLIPSQFGLLYRGVPQPPISDGPMINTATGESVTLGEVNDDLAWRRDTVEKLRRLPTGPRF